MPCYLFPQSSHIIAAAFLPFSFVPKYASDAATEEANQSEEDCEKLRFKVENRKLTAAEALKKLDEVKNFIEVNGSDHLNMIFNELVENMEQIKLKNQKTK